MRPSAVIAAVEGGGTSFVVAVCICNSASSTSINLNNNNNSEQDAIISATNLPQIIHRISIDSSHDDPHRTLRECVEFLQQHKPRGGGYDVLAVGSFGPLGTKPGTPEYGTILKSSPKAPWRKVDILTPLRNACSRSNDNNSNSNSNNNDDHPPLKVVLDTDVNAPAWGEYLLANSTVLSETKVSARISSLAYITVGTGVGVGLVINDRPVHGWMHPEGGHVPVQPLETATKKYKDDDDTTTTPTAPPTTVFTGYSWGIDTAPFGGQNTVEGLSSSVALTERLHQQQQQQHSASSSSLVFDRSILAQLSDDHEIWDHAANALANLCVTLLLTVSVERIVLGGGLMQRTVLLEKIRQRTETLLNGYLDLPPLNDLIVTSQFGNDAGLMGTIILGQSVLLGIHNNNNNNDDNNNNNNNNKKLIREQEETEMKQTAFGIGFMQGIMVGALTAALVCKYCFVLPKRK